MSIVVILCTVWCVVALWLNVRLLRGCTEKAEVATQAQIDAKAEIARLALRMTKIQTLLVESIDLLDKHNKKLSTDIETLYSNQLYFEKALAEAIKGIVSDGSRQKPN